MPELWTVAATAVWEGVTKTVSTVTNDAVLMLPIAVAFVGAAIGLGKRLLRFGGRRK